MPDVFDSQNEDGKSNSTEEVKSSTNNANEQKEDPITNLTPETDVHSLPDHTHNIFTSYCVFPDQVKFASSDPDERVVLLLRRHPITNLPWIIIAFFMLIVPSVFPFLPLVDRIPGNFLLIITLIWYLITSSYILENFLEWFFNINLVTTERVLDVDFVDLLYREVSEAELEKIQEPTFEIGGALRSFFNFGDVLIETAAEVSRIEFLAVPHPDKVVKVLRDLGIKEEVERMKRRYS